MKRMIRFFYVICFFPVVCLSALIWMVSYIWNGKESNLEPFDVSNMIVIIWERNDFKIFLPKLFSVFCCTLINFVYLYSVENDV